MRRLVLVIVCAALAGCEDTTAAPHMDAVCTKSHTRTILMPVMIGKIMMMQPHIQTVCDETERRCVWGRDYVGPKVCR